MQNTTADIYPEDMHDGEADLIASIGDPAADAAGLATALNSAISALISASNTMQGAAKILANAETRAAMSDDELRSIITHHSEQISRTYEYVTSEYATTLLAHYLPDEV